MKGLSPLVKLLIGILAILGFALLVQHRFHADVAAFHDQPWDPQLLLKRVTVVGWNHGQRLWRFSSDELRVDHQGRFLTYKGKGVGELFQDDKPLLTIRAPRIRFDMLTRGVQAIGGVFLNARPHTELSTSQLFWNQYSQRLYVPGSVRVTSPYGTVTARHLILVAYQGELRVLGVKMAFDPRALDALSKQSLGIGTNAQAFPKDP